MDMLYSDYIDMVNSLMIQAFLHNCNVEGVSVYDAESGDEIILDDNDGILIDEA